MSTFVMTGATSGFGALAAARMAQSDTHRLVIGARRTATVGETLPLDSASLVSVRAFAAVVQERLEGATIDGLVLNAGMIRPDVDGRTSDGHETTFAVNHLAHYLLVRLLLTSLAMDAIVVLTSSASQRDAPPRGWAATEDAWPSSDGVQGPPGAVMVRTAGRCPATRVRSW